MERNINIAKILKDKPKGTKLYADAFGELSLECVILTQYGIIYTKTQIGTFRCFYNDGKYNEYGEPILVPSKKMRDWSKFSWKKGDVLVSKDNNIHVIFEKFNNDDYLTFTGKHYYCIDVGLYIPE